LRPIAIKGIAFLEMNRSKGKPESLLVKLGPLCRHHPREVDLPYGSGEPYFVTPEATI